jgi:NADPH2:quinone reductase
VASPGEIRESLALALDGRISVPIARTFPMREAAAAHAFMEQREHVGKIVLVRE